VIVVINISSADKSVARPLQAKIMQGTQTCWKLRTAFLVRRCGARRPHETALESQYILIMPPSSVDKPTTNQLW
jgi:hypothetical protein